MSAPRQQFFPADDIDRRCLSPVRTAAHVESEEVGLSPFLRPLAQTARAVFPQAAFLCDRLR